MLSKRLLRKHVRICVMNLQLFGILCKDDCEETINEPGSCGFLFMHMETHMSCTDSPPVEHSLVSASGCVISTYLFITN